MCVSLPRQGSTLANHSLERLCRISTGTMVSYWVDLGFSYIDSSVSWRVPIALQCIFAVILCVMLIWLPESPRWLISKGHMVEGQRVVAALDPSPFDSEETILQVKVIHDSLEGQLRQRKRDLITNGPTQHFRRMMLGSSSQLFQQIGGCNAVICASHILPVSFPPPLRFTIAPFTTLDAVRGRARTSRSSSRSARGRPPVKSTH